MTSVEGYTKMQYKVTDLQTGEFDLFDNWRETSEWAQMFPGVIIERQTIRVRIESDPWMLISEDNEKSDH